MPSRREVKIHINRALRSRGAEQKLDEIALAIGELARYVEDVEKAKLGRLPQTTDTQKILRVPVRLFPLKRVAETSAG
jgi:hypothetical protein